MTARFLRTARMVLLCLVLAASGLTMAGGAASAEYGGDDCEIDLQFDLGLPTTRGAAPCPTVHVDEPSIEPSELMPHVVIDPSAIDPSSELTIDLEAPPSSSDGTDSATGTAMGSVQPCSYPGGAPAPMYTSSRGSCKYTQALSITKCTVMNANGRCFERKLIRYGFRGGTADYRSPTLSGKCAYAGRSDVGSWRVLDINVVAYRTGTLLARAPSSLYGSRTNCDVEKLFYYAWDVTIPSGGAVLTYNFRHYCRAGTNCLDFPTSVQFYLSGPD